MIWLVTLGLSRRHGSELMVGWQWFERLRSRGPVTAIVHSCFDHADYIDPEDRLQLRFVDTGLADPDEINRRHIHHAWHFWRGARRILRDEAVAGDRLVIVCPAGLWFVPWIRGLPIARDHCFHGPIAATFIPGAPLRNAMTCIVAAVWRMGAPWLPARLAFRYPMPWLRERLGRRFAILAELPEVELPPVGGVPGRGASHCIAILHDARPRKNFAASLAEARRLARDRGLPLVVIGAPAPLPEADNLARMPRTAFLAWLRAERPLLVLMSPSEGVSSLLIEALLAGCTVRVLPVGGVQWLIRFAIEASSPDPATGAVSLRWGGSSARDYAAFARSRFDRLTDEIIAG